MRAVLCFISLLAILSGCAAPKVPPLFANARSQTYLVATPHGHGTGVIINDHCVLTAGHVADGDEYFVVDDKGTPVAAHKVAIDDVVDVAVVCANIPLQAKPVTFARSMPEQYAPVFTIGHPLNASLVLTTGRYELNGLISAPAAPGNSGGGVFNADGEYIGLVDTISLYPSTAGVLTFSHLVGIVEVTAIRKFLDDNHVTYSVAT